MKSLKIDKLAKLEGGNYFLPIGKCPKGQVPIAITHVWFPGGGIGNVLCVKLKDRIRMF